MIIDALLKENLTKRKPVVFSYDLSTNWFIDENSKGTDLTIKHAFIESLIRRRIQSVIKRALKRGDAKKLTNNVYLVDPIVVEEVIYEFKKFDGIDFMELAREYAARRGIPLASRSIVEARKWLKRLKGKLALRISVNEKVEVIKIRIRGV